ncbi:hypothetical protein Q3V30_18745 [Erwinia pyri]|uniref:Uncharacterized protein n=1 Tax=Erwinia pyri TaxID=3062598 RepID=A0AA50HPX0_9GAMM|nr:hypothetical protein [Erwinia sp. DE2]WLS78470.1 hypothetical protein Q3V30_18745 [Erwinia sp. DE2]
MDFPFIIDKTSAEHNSADIGRKMASSSGDFSRLKGNNTRIPRAE